MFGLRLAALSLCATPLLFAGNPNPPRFDQYPVSEIFRGTPAAPILATPQLRAYRTSIRNAVRTGGGAFRPTGEPDQPGPNFAGRYLLMGAGCGSDCLIVAMVDAVTGQILKFPDPDGIYLSRSGGGPFLPRLEFRLDSNLLVITPCPNVGPVEDHYYLWTGTLWKLLQRIPQSADQPD